MLPSMFLLEKKKGIQHIKFCRVSARISFPKTNLEKKNGLVPYLKESYVNRITFRRVVIQENPFILFFFVSY